MGRGLGPRFLGSGFEERLAAGFCLRRTLEIMEIILFRQLVRESVRPYRVAAISENGNSVAAGPVFASTADMQWSEAPESGSCL